MKQAVWEAILLEGRAIKLSDMARTLLDLIGKAGPDGILQTDLSRLARMDLRNLHYHLGVLYRNSVMYLDGLIRYICNVDCRVRFPVASKKTFTYLCIHSKFYSSGDELLMAQTITCHDETSVKVPVGLLMKRFTEILESAPDQSLQAVDLYRLYGVPGSRTALNYYRSCLKGLVESGHVEMILTKGIGGPRLPIYRFKKVFNSDSPVNNKVEQNQVDQLEEEEEGGCLGIGEEYRPFISVEKQARDLVAESGSKGSTLFELKKALGLTTKNVFKVHTRLTDGKSIVNSDITKCTEFSGKERRHRLFLEGKMNESIAEATSMTSSAVPSGTSTPCPIPSSNTPTAAASPASKRYESVTNVFRRQCLLEILMSKDPPILELSKWLGSELGTMVAAKSHQNQSYSTDMKTLKRTAQGMVDEGRLQILTVAGSKAEKILIFPTGMALDDPRLEERIRLVKEGTSRIMDLSREEPTIDSVEGVDQVVRRKSSYYGYVYGTIQKIRLLHLYIVGKVKPGDTFQTPTILFEQFPLGLFLQIIGITITSPRLDQFLTDMKNHAMSMEELPPEIRRELMLRRGSALRSHIRDLCQMLVALGLLVSVDDAFSARMAFKIPLSFRLSSLVHVPVPPDGHSAGLMEFEGINEATAFWNRLYEDWVQKIDTTLTPVQEDFSPILKLAMRPEQWSTERPVTMKQAGHNALMSDDQLAESLGIPVGYLQKSYRKLRSKRPASALTLTAAEPRSVSLKRPRLDKSNNNFNTASWTREELDDLKLVSVLLHQPDYCTAGTTLSWSLAEGLIPGKGNPTMLRVIGTRVLMADWEQAKDLLRLEKRVQLYSLLFPFVFDDVSDGLKERFRAHFEHLKSVLQEWPSIQGYLKKPDINEDVDLKKVWSLGQSRVIGDWHRIRHYRNPLMSHFFDLPSYIHPSHPTHPIHPNPPDYVEECVVAIKTIMVWPGSTYKATEASLFLSRFPDPTISASLQWLIQEGFLTKNSTGMHRYRVPGTSYALSRRVAVSLMEQQEHADLPVNLDDDFQLSSKTAQRLDLNQVIDGLLDGDIVPSSYSAAGSSFMLTGQLKPCIPGMDELEAALKKLELWAAPGRLWFWHQQQQQVLFNGRVMRNALRMVRRLIEEDPGLDRAKLASVARPLLTVTELDDLIRVLGLLGLAQLKHQNLYPYQ